MDRVARERPWKKAGANRQGSASWLALWFLHGGEMRLGESLGFQHFLELLACHELLLEHQVEDFFSCGEGVAGDFGGACVTKEGAQRRNEGRRLVEQPPCALAVGSDASHATVGKR